ncbi:radical SAM/SPASM domain-containing protein [Nocardiopsis prasina]|uniref:radical SAM/SPASM domain-containing protein n=1 Tax=Nocardiopsis prasina TaxID=2015 RepID=UPI00034ABAF6|nr:radical SAM protein [Nocardiopsis prasina]
MADTTVTSTFRPSRFNVVTRTDDGDAVVLYNSMRGSVFRVQDPVGHRVHDLLHNRRSVLRRPDPGTADESRLFDTLVTKGFLVAEEHDELAEADALRDRRKNRTDRLELIIMPTEACNFRCTYCYEDFALGRMLTEVREGIKSLVRRHRREHGIERLTVAWFGGEPLVAFDVIEELSTFFLEFCAEEGIEYSAGITTNGLLLTPEVARRCVELGISNYQVTLDGPAHTHDSSRFLMGGGKTFDEIIANLTRMAETDADFRVIVRTNFTEANSVHVPELIEQLGGLYAGDPRFGVIYRPVGDWGGPQGEESEAYAGKQAEMTKLDLCSNAVESGLAPADDVFLKPNGSVCYAASPWSFVIRPNGLVNKCTVALRDPRNAVGQLGADGDLGLDQELMSLWVDNDDAKDSGCHSCFFRPSCQGAHCPLVRIQEGTRPCPPQKVWIGPTITTVASNGRTR